MTHHRLSDDGSRIHAMSKMFGDSNITVMIDHDDRISAKYIRRTPLGTSTPVWVVPEFALIENEAYRAITSPDPETRSAGYIALGKAHERFPRPILTDDDVRGMIDSIYAVWVDDSLAYASEDYFDWYYG